MPKKILITGIAGQVGSLLTDYLLEETDLHIVGLMRWQDTLTNLHHLANRINQKDRVEIAYGDINDYTALSRIIRRHRPNFVSHLAAQSFPSTSFNAPIETLQTNIVGTANILEAIRSEIEDSEYSPVVHVCSSSEVYGKQPRDTLITEETGFHGASPYSISKIGTDFLGRFYGEAYGLRTFVTRMGTHSGRRRSDVFFESTVAKQIALIEAGLQEPVIYVGNLSSTRTYQDTRDAVKAYYLLMRAADQDKIKPGDFFNIAGEEVFELQQIVDMLLSFSTKSGIGLKSSPERLRPIDANYQMFSNDKLRSVVDWHPQITVKEMLLDLLNHWRSEIKLGRIPLNR